MTSETTAIYAHRCPDLQAKLPFLSSAQANRLEDFFTRDKNPQIADVVIIAAELGLPVQAVRVGKHRFCIAFLMCKKANF